MLFPSKVKERYEIREELGAGGMGAVYRAYDKVIKYEVAIKTLLDIADAEALRMFHEECDKLARMVHPNIVEIRDIGEFDNGKGKQPYLVMPLLRGATLDQLIKAPGQRLSPQRAVDILTQACRGLQAAHDAGLVHRDLKPSNIFVLEDDSVKLIDFGVAHWTDNAHTKGRKGTILFMSPEQILVKGISALSDIFSLGVVAYQTLTGRNPFERRTEEEIVQAVLNFVPPPASEYNSDVTLGLSQAVHKAMAKQPSNRYRNAREFGETLQKAINQQPIELFNPARIQPRVDRANQALEKKDLELASEIVLELETEGFLDPQVVALRGKVEQLSRQKKLLNLLDGARTRLTEQEYPLALQKIQEALEIDRNNADALALKENVESRRAEQSVNDWLQLARQHTENFAYDRAREALQNVLQLKTNDSRALAMLADVDRRKSDYEKIMREKEQLHLAAQASFNRGEISSALSKMGRVLKLDQQAPDRSNAERSTAYESLYNQICSEHDSLQNAYTEARGLQTAGNYSGALAICNSNIAKHPGHALLLALKLDLEVSQRKQLSGFIAEVDRRVDNEPDLDKRLGILKDATDKFPDVEHFQTSLRLTREKRDLMESIVSKAHVFEDQGQFGESLSQWEILRSIYDRYPGLEFEFQRLRKRRDQQSKSEERARCLEQIEQALDSNQHSRAIELLEAAKQDFPGDVDLAHAETAARQGMVRATQAQELLRDAEQMRTENRLQEAADTLQRAYTLDRSNANICEALQSALIEQARAIMEKDWRTASTLLTQAQDLGSGHYAVKGLLRAVADRKREEEIGEILRQARELQTSGDIRGAYFLTAEKLKTYPQDLDIQQLNNRLKKQYEALRKQDLESVQRLTADTDADADPASLKTLLDQTSDSSSRYPEDEEFRRVRDRVRDRFATATRDTPIAPAAPPARPSVQPPVEAPAVVPRPSVPVLTKEPAVTGAFLSRNRVWLAAGGILLLAGIGVLLRKPSKPLLKKAIPVVAVQAPTTLSVRTIPPGATLVINKSVRGIGDGSPIAVAPGNSIIEASLPGYQPATRQLVVNAGDKKATEIPLQLLAPSMRIETTLNTGQVFVDDKQAGDLQAGQYSLDTVPDGPHKLQVKGEHSFGFSFQTSAESIAASSLYAGTGGTLVLVGNSRGKLQVLCNRPGLTLAIDDQVVGACAQTTQELQAIEPGRHRLEVKEGKQSLGVKTVDLGPATALGAYLLGDSDQGMLMVTANEDEFLISLDRRNLTAPAKHGKWKRALSPGDHLIAARKDGFTVQPESAKVHIEKGKDFVAPFTFTAIPITATYRIKVDPGAEIFIDNKLKGSVAANGTIEIPDLAQGVHDLSIRKKGFLDHNESVSLVKGKNFRELSLQKAQAHLRVTANPPSATLKITREGETAGHVYLAPVHDDLPDGNYEFEARADGYTSIKEQVKLSAGETYTHEFQLIKVDSKPALKAWPKWSLLDGYEVKKGGSFTPVRSGTPSRISFSAVSDRTGIFASRGGAVQWTFQAANGSGALNFHLDDKGLAWNGTGKAADLKGKSRAALDKGEHKVLIDASGSTIRVSVDGGTASLVEFDLASFSVVEFGFRIDSNETLRVKNFKFE